MWFVLVRRLKVGSVQSIYNKLKWCIPRDEVTEGQQLGWIGVEKYVVVRLYQIEEGFLEVFKLLFFDDDRCKIVLTRFTFTSENKELCED